MTDMVQSTAKTGVQTMTKDNYERKRKAVVISLSPAQVEALDAAATAAGKNRSEFLREMLMEKIADFPDDLDSVGQYDRK